MEPPEDGPWGGAVGDRLEFLERLAREPAEKPALVDDLECSRSTVDRAVRRLETAGLVERTTDGYAATAAGRVAATRYRAHREEQRTIRDARSVLAPLDAAEAPPADAFAEATVTTDGAFDRLARGVRKADAYRVALPALPDTRLLRLLHAGAVRDELTAEVLVSDALADRLRTEFPSLTRDLLAASSCTLRRGETPAYGLVLSTGDGETTAAVFTAESARIIGVIETADPTAVNRLGGQFRERLATAAALPDPPAGVDGTALDSTDPDRLLSRAGVVRVDESYFSDRTPEEPETAWRVGMELADVYYGYATDRLAGSEDDETLASEAVVERARTGRGVVVVGPSGVGKSTLCRQVACRWVETMEGAVYYRTASRSGDLAALADRLAELEGEALVVVEDAAGEGFLRFWRRVRDDPTVAVVGETRERAWRGLLGEVADPKLREAADRLAEYRPPPVDETTCERALETFERVTGRDVPVSPDALSERVRSEDGIGDLVVLSHQLLARAVEAPWADDPVGVSALDADVRETYSVLEDAQAPALTAGTLTAALAAAELPVGPATVHALGARPEGSHEAVEAAIDELDGRVVVTERDGERFRTHHRQWAIRFLEHALERDERATVARFERGVNAVLALADEPERRRSVEAWLGRDSGRIARLATEDGVEEFVETLFTQGTDASTLAPLFGTTEHSGIELPAACPPAAQLECRACRGKMWYDYGDPDRAERELATLCDRAAAVDADRATRTRYLAEAHRGLAEVVVDSGAVERARESLRQGLAAATDGDHPRLAVGVRNSLAWVAMTVDDYDEADRQLQQARERCSDLGPCGDCSDTFYYLARLEQFRGDLGAAEKWLSRTIELDRELGNVQNRSSSLKLLADLARERGATDRAADRYRQSLELKREVRDRPGEAQTLFDFGQLRLDEGETAAASAAFEKSLDIARNNGMERHVGRVQGALGRLALTRSDLDRAVEHFDTQREIHAAVDHQRGVAAATAGLGDVARERGNLEHARTHYETALEQYRDIDASGEALDVLDRLVETCRESADFEAALARCERGIELAEEIGRQNERSTFADHLEELEQTLD